MKETENNEIEIQVNMTMSVGEVKFIDLSNTNVPINMLQLYMWSSDTINLNVSEWGQMYGYSLQPGTIVTITGTYIINPRVTIIIRLTII